MSAILRKKLTSEDVLASRITGKIRGEKVYSSIKMLN